MPLSKKAVRELQSTVDDARRAINRANNLLIIILEECKRPPYVTADEATSVFDDLDGASQDIEAALEMMVKAGEPLVGVRS